MIFHDINNFGGEKSPTRHFLNQIIILYYTEGPFLVHKPTPDFTPDKIGLAHTRTILDEPNHNHVLLVVNDWETAKHTGLNSAQFFLSSTNHQCLNNIECSFF